MKIEKIIEEYLISKKIPLKSSTNKEVVPLILEGYRKAGWAAQTASRWTKKYFPQKPAKQYLKTFILNELDLAQCTKCKTVDFKINFHSNIARSSKVNTYCPACHLNYQRDNKTSYTRNTAKYKAAKLSRTPKWANLQDIADFYSKCPEGCHVDHIIPLQGNKVSGLHILENLQYLPASENCAKRNKFTPP